MRIEIKWLVFAAAALLALILIGMKIMGDRAAETRQADADRGAAVAMQEAGQAAVATVLEQTQEEVALGDLVEQASEEIDNAPDPKAARAATISAACQLQLYRDDPACAVRATDSP